MVRSAFLILFISSVSIGFSQEEDVLIWGIYLDLENARARNAARSLSEGGYVLRVDDRFESPYFLLSPGSTNGITRFMRNRRKDGIRIHGFVPNSDECDEKSFEKDSLVKYKHIRNNFITQFAIQTEDNVPSRIQKAGPEAVKKYIGNQNWLFRKYLKQKANPGDLSGMAWTALGSPLNDSWPVEEISYQFIKKRKKLATLRFDTIPGQRIEELKAFRTGSCAPYERTTKFKELYGLGPERYKPMYYVPRSEKKTTRRFELHFEKNKTNYSQEDIREIVNLMRGENLSIQRAIVEGYASVEGSLENNIKLQEKRANILVDILQRYNDEEIVLDTVITRETWELFRTEIKKTKYAWLDSLGNDAIKAQLEDKSLSQALEPILKKGRRAALTLVLSTKLSDEEKVDFVMKDINAALYFLCNPEEQTFKFDYRQRLFGILNYMESAVERGIMTQERVRDAISGKDAFTDVLLYKLYGDFVNDRLSGVYDLESAIDNAQSLYSELLILAKGSRSKTIKCVPRSTTFLNQLTDVYELARLVSEKGTEMELSYPDQWEFYPIILHHLQKEGIEGTKFVADAEKLDNVPVKRSGENSPFYYLLKKIVLEGDQKIKDYVYRSDHLLEFDTWWFLAYSVANWDESAGTYADPEVDRHEMNRQLNRLSRMRKHLCPWQLDQLKLDFYLKNLHSYLKQGMFEEIDQKLMVTSFNYIKKYFMDNADKLDEETSLAIANQLVLLDNLYMTRTGSQAAYQLLRKVEKTTQFGKEGQKTILRLAYYHDPSFIKLINAYDDPNWCDLFRGKYGLIPYGSLVSRVCQECN